MPVGDQRGWAIQSDALPATTRSPTGRPWSSSSARTSSVPSQGRFGWSQRVLRLAVAGERPGLVVLADREDPVAPAIQAEVGEPPRPSVRRERLEDAGLRDPLEAAGRE